MGGCLCIENKFNELKGTNIKNKNQFSTISHKNNIEQKIIYSNLINKSEKLVKINKNENSDKYKNKQILKKNHTLDKKYKNKENKEKNSSIKPIKKRSSSLNLQLKKSLILKGKNIINIVLIGEKQTGKSCFLIKLIENRFENLYIPTIFIEKNSKEYFYNNNIYILNFNVTPGIEEYKNDYKELYSESNFILLFFEIGRNDIVENAKIYVKKELKNHLFIYSNNCSNIFFIGNKIDLYYDKNNNDIKLFCEKNKINFFEISVKTNVGINLLIRKIIQTFSQLSSIT